MVVGGVWIPVTLLASSAQTLRNAMQRDLIVPGLYLAAFDREGARHYRRLAFVAVCRLHGRARVATLVHRLCA